MSKENPNEFKIINKNERLKYRQTINELKQQLAEKDCRIEELEGQFAYECECNKQLVELQKQLEKKQNEIDEINKEFVQAVHDWKALCAEKDKEINSLIIDYEKRISQEQELMSNMEHLLTEKQNAIDEINKEFVQAIHDWKTLCAEKDKEIERLKFFEKAYYYNQLQASQEDIQKFQQLANQNAININYIAIQELEKVKNFVDGRTYCADYINKRIQELKGEK